MFAAFEIIGSSAGWMRAENTLIQTAGYAFRKAAGEISGDFGAEFSKTKTLGAGVRIFNGAVRTEREFPLKILFLACIQGFSVLLYSAERRSKSPQPISEYDFCLLCIKVFSDFFQSHAADKFKSSPTNIITDLSPRSSVFSAAGISSAENVCCFGSPVFTAIFQR